MTAYNRFFICLEEGTRLLLLQAQCCHPANNHSSFKILLHSLWHSIGCPPAFAFATTGKTGSCPLFPRFGARSGLIYPAYGCGELPQAFCRIAAVEGALYVSGFWPWFPSNSFGASAPEVPG